jgi:hypothetical protein
MPVLGGFAIWSTGLFPDFVSSLPNKIFLPPTTHDKTPRYQQVGWFIVAGRLFSGVSPAEIPDETVGALPAAGNASDLKECLAQRAAGDLR